MPYKQRSPPPHPEEYNASGALSPTQQHPPGNPNYLAAAAAAAAQASMPRLGPHSRVPAAIFVPMDADEDLSLGIPAPAPESRRERLERILALVEQHARLVEANISATYAQYYEDLEREMMQFEAGVLAAVRGREPGHARQQQPDAAPGEGWGEFGPAAAASRTLQQQQQQQHHHQQQMTTTGGGGGGGWASSSGAPRFAWAQAQAEAWREMAMAPDLDDEEAQLVLRSVGMTAEEAGKAVGLAPSNLAYNVLVEGNPHFKPFEPNLAPPPREDAPRREKFAYQRLEQAAGLAGQIRGYRDHVAGVLAWYRNVLEKEIVREANFVEGVVDGGGSGSGTVGGSGSGTVGGSGSGTSVVVGSSVGERRKGTAPTSVGSVLTGGATLDGIVR